MKRIYLCAFVLLALVWRVHATINVVNYWHLGENDPGTAPGGAMTNSLAIVGGLPLTNSGTLTYTADVSTNANAATGSYLAVQFTNDAYATSSVIAGLTDNFGVEMWVNPATASGSQSIFYNGNTGGSGWGLYIEGNQFYGLFGGVSFIHGSLTFAPGTWNHVALVESGGTTTLYVNGAVSATLARTPFSPAGQLTVGANQAGTENFGGLIDEIRVFTFSPGQFSTNDLLLNQVPSYNLALANIQVPASAGSTNVALTVSPSNALWLAAANVSWLHLSSAAGMGSANLAVSFDENDAPSPRTGTLTLATNTLAVTQAAANPISFNTNGVGWVLNGSPAPEPITSNVLPLTDGGIYESRSAWFAYPLNVGSFLASFTYQDVGGSGADGVAFVIQNSPSGTNALGGNGGYLGYAGIAPSVAVLLNIYYAAAGGPSSFLVATNGNGDGAGYSSPGYQSTAPVNLDSGDPVAVTLAYSGGILNLTLADTVSGSVYKTNYAVDIPGFVGTNTAWVGFTGADGSLSSHQMISDFTYFWPLPALGLSTNLFYEPLTAGSDSVTLTVSPDSVAWAATANVSWLHLAVLNGTGSTNVGFSFDANTAPNAGPRSGTLTIAGQNVTVYQASAISLATNTFYEPLTAGSDSVNLTVSSGIVTWTAAANVSWLHLAVTNGTGSANVGFSFDANMAANAGPRSGTLTFAGQTVTVYQASATYLLPTNTFY